jgi:arylsulfatase
MKIKLFKHSLTALAASAVLFCAVAHGQTAGNDHTKYKTYGSKPNIVTIISDDTGYWDLGPYGGGKARGMDTPNFDKMAKAGMMFTDFYGQPSCTPGRAAMLTGRIPNRSGMTTVAFQGQGGGLPKGEWTLASVLKQAGYSTYFAGKWHLGEADYAMPTAHGFDKMENVLLYHLNAMTYGLPDWDPQMTPEQKAFFRKVTKGILEGTAGGPARDAIPYDNSRPRIWPISTCHGPEVRRRDGASGQGRQALLHVHQLRRQPPAEPAFKAFVGASAVKSKYGDKVVELDATPARS